MAEVTIRLQREDSGELQILIDLQSDEDFLPQEHEQLHRKVVARLLPSVKINGESRPGIKVQRERPAREPVVG